MTYGCLQRCYNLNTTAAFEKQINGLNDHCKDVAVIEKLVQWCYGSVYDTFLMGDSGQNLHFSYISAFEFLPHLTKISFKQKQFHNSLIGRPLWSFLVYTDPACMEPRNFFLHLSCYEGK